MAALNKLCVRLVFLFYAEDAELFPKDAFWRFLKETPAKFLRGQLMKLFRVLDTPVGKRDPYLEPELCAFPYTNGGLFKGADESDIPPLDDEIKELLIRSANFDWREISPTIFGALFESTLNPVTRRAGGMVYTSVENIHKVIDPLFLSALEKRFEEICNCESVKICKCENMEMGKCESFSYFHNSTFPQFHNFTLSPRQRRELLALQDEMASLTFLDPACGSGNFLTETYICLRRLENRIIAALQQGQGELDLDDGRDGLCPVRGRDEARPSHNRVKVSIAQFHGIEINDFAVAVAKTALWIAEAQMLQETAQILHREPDYLPLKDYNGIVEGNALRMDWGGLLTSDAGLQIDPTSGVRRPMSFNFIMGNPPFSGARWMGKEQKADVLDVFGKDWQGVGDLDYVCCWYKKAMDCITAGTGCPPYQDGDSVGSRVPRDRDGRAVAPRPPRTKVAFVSTNSICQGGAVANLWKPLFAQGLEIDFAHRTFRWDNEAFDKAHVHCVIIGFHCDQELLSLPGDSESRSLGENSKKSSSLQNSKTPSSESKTLRTSRTSREIISQTAQSILDARAQYPDVTLAQMYGDKMYLFPELVAAHEANDRAVLAAYGLVPDTPEPEIVAHLFKLYAEMTNRED